MKGETKSKVTAGVNCFQCPYCKNRGTGFLVVTLRMLAKLRVAATQLRIDLKCHSGGHKFPVTIFA